jgi:hypothetical protein
VAQLDARNLAALAEGAALLLDGTDNLETRYLLNDFAVERGVPWIYAGVVGASGLVLPVLPRGSMPSSRPAGACLACLFPSAPPPGVLPTCDTAGVILPAVALVASLASGLALRILARGVEDVEPALLELDAWGANVRRFPAPRDPECRVCAQGIFEHLRRPAPRDPLVLCGRNAVQIPASAAPPELELLAQRLASTTGDLQASRAFLRFTIEGSRLTVFRDGRVLVEGTSDPRRARALADRWIGS